MALPSSREIISDLDRGLRLISLAAEGFSPSSTGRDAGSGDAAIVTFPNESIPISVFHNVEYQHHYC